MICATEHKSAAPLTPTDAAVSPWHLQNTKIHMELFASPYIKQDKYVTFLFANAPVFIIQCSGLAKTLFSSTGIIQFVNELTYYMLMQMWL